MTEQQFLIVPNWDKFQHYNKRTPPWIKLQTRLIDGDSIEYTSLTDVQKLHLIHIWLLASRHDNRIPYKTAWLQQRLNITEPLDIQPLIDGGLLRIVGNEGHDSAPQDVSRETVPEHDVWFEQDFWPLYRDGCAKLHGRRPGSKGKAKKAAGKLPMETRPKILRHLIALTAADKGIIGAGRFTPAWPDAHKYIEDERWTDDVGLPDAKPKAEQCGFTKTHAGRCGCAASHDNVCGFHSRVIAGMANNSPQGFWHWYPKSGATMHPARLWGYLGGKEADIEKIMADEREVGLG